MHPCGPICLKSLHNRTEEICRAQLSHNYLCIGSLNKREKHSYVLGSISAYTAKPVVNFTDQWVLNTGGYLSITLCLSCANIYMQDPAENRRSICSCKGWDLCLNATFFLFLEVSCIHETCFHLGKCYTGCNPLITRNFPLHIKFKNKFNKRKWYQFTAPVCRTVSGSTDGKFKSIDLKIER